MSQLPKKNWWKEAVVYQIYPRSFSDSNGDGVGDLKGVIHKLDYLQKLGIDVIWMSPMYKSPQDDNGYDISDYQDIHSEFGSMEDFDQLLAECRRRGIKLLIDLVINHTSDEHPWFVESRSSRDNPKRDWYIWKDGKNGQEPNNWESIFGGSAWQLDPLTGQYYLHIFSAKQPDLNWENLQMREAVYKMIRWWLDKGIDGFRIDAISHAKKEPGLPDLPNPDHLPYVPSYGMHMNRPGIQDYITDLCRQTFNHYDIMTIGEANGVSAEDAEEWVGEEQKKFNMLIQFEHIGLWQSDTNGSSADKIDLPKLKQVLTRWQKNLENRGWNALFVENHDLTRVVSKWGDTTNYWRESSTSIAMMYFLMQGTPLIYQGQEIGMTNTRFEGPDDFNDVAAKNLFKLRRRQGVSDEKTLAELQNTSRDHARTPMQWNAERNAGFSLGKPWLKVNPNYVDINVQKQDRDPQSILNFYRDLIQLRKAHPIFVYGQYSLILNEHPQIYAYSRTYQKKRAWVFCNLTARVAPFADPQIQLQSHNLLLSNYPVAAHANLNGTELKPFECRLYLME